MYFELSLSLADYLDITHAGRQPEVKNTSLKMQKYVFYIPVCQLQCEDLTKASKLRLGRSL